MNENESTSKGILHMFQGTSRQLVAVVAATITAISDGMQYGWSAPIVPILQGPSSPIKITDRDVELIETVFLIGALMGLPVIKGLVDRIGRKNTILFACLTNLIGWTMIAFATTATPIHIARFLTGLASDVNFVAAPMFVAEIADQKIRGFLAGIIYLMVLVGILVVYSVAPFVSIFTSCVLGIIILLFQLVTFPFMPESPYYLLMKNKPEEAKKSLERYREEGTNIQEEFEDISKAIKRQTSEKGRVQDLILVPSNRKALIIMTVLNGAQHFSSISVLLMNLHLVLRAADSAYISSNAAAIIFSAIMLAAASSSSLLMDKYGRKIILIFSSSFTTFFLLALAVFFSFKKNDFDVSGCSWIPVLAIMAYAASFKFGMGMVPVVLQAELFPAKMKAIGMALSSAMYIAFAIFSIHLFQSLKGYGYDVPFYIFSASCFLTTVFCYFYIPETKGKTLEEIQMMLKGESYKPSEIQKIEID